MSLKKRAIDVVGILVYTLLVSQLTLMMREPVVVREYIKVEVPAYQEVVEDIEEVKKVNEKEWLRNIPLSEELQKYTWDLANKYDISYDMILGLMKTESSFNPKAINKNTNLTKDIGICQINENTKSLAEQLAGRNLDLFNPKDNILAAVLILNDYRSQLINSGITSQEDLFEQTILAFNRGVNGSKKYIASRGTTRSDYVKKVLKYKMKLESEGGL